MPKKPVKKPSPKVSKKSYPKKYIPGDKEKYMCVKHKQFFTEQLLNWKKVKEKIKQVVVGLKLKHWRVWGLFSHKPRSRINS